MVKCSLPKYNFIITLVKFLMNGKRKVFFAISFHSIQCFFSRKLRNRVSISPIFFEQVLRTYSCAKKVQTETVSTKKLHVNLSYEKSGHRMLVKLTTSLKNFRRRQFVLSSFSFNKILLVFDRLDHLQFDLNFKWIFWSRLMDWNCVQKIWKLTDELRPNGQSCQ